MSHIAKAVQYSATKEHVLHRIGDLFENMQADLEYMAHKNAQSDSFIRALADGDYDDINKVIAAAQILAGDA
jgi:hypothetical protein